MLLITIGGRRSSQMQLSLMKSSVEAQQVAKGLWKGIIAIRDSVARSHISVKSQSQFFPLTGKLYYILWLHCLLKNFVIFSSHLSTVYDWTFFGTDSVTPLDQRLPAELYFFAEVHAAKWNVLPAHVHCCNNRVWLYHSCFNLRGWVFRKASVGNADK